MKLVLDTNVLIAAFAARGLCSELFRLCLDRHEIVSSSELLDEFERNLVKKLKLPRPAAADVTAWLRQHTSVLTPGPVAASSCRDASDLHVLGLAAAAKASFIVSGDKDLLIIKRFRRIPVFSPPQAWQYLKHRG